MTRNLQLQRVGLTIKEEIHQAVGRSGLAAATALLLLAAGGSNATAAAEPDRVEARFEIYGFAGFHVLTNRTTVEQFGDRYTIATDLNTRGLASVFVDLTSHSQVSGRLGSEVPYPESYRADVKRDLLECFISVLTAMDYSQILD